MTDSPPKPGQAGAQEIEITPEMIEAAVPYLFENDRRFDNEREIVEAIYRAMAQESAAAALRPVSDARRLS